MLWIGIYFCCKLKFSERVFGVCSFATIKLKCNFVDLKFYVLYYPFYLNVDYWFLSKFEYKFLQIGFCCFNKLNKYQS